MKEMIMSIDFTMFTTALETNAYNPNEYQSRQHRVNMVYEL
jgi:hypothetical protein